MPTTAVPSCDPVHGTALGRRAQASASFWLCMNVSGADGRADVACYCFDGFVTGGWEAAMSWTRFRVTASAVVLALAASAGAATVAGPAGAAQASGGQSGGGACIAHHPNSD